MNRYNNLTFILGGAKSGKTDFAICLGNKIKGKKVYLATARILDEEMAEKVRQHKKSRGEKWDTLEEPEKIDESLLSLNSECSIVILDCMTLWLSNMVCDDMEEEAVITRVNRLIDTVEHIDYTLIIVSNEVGMGIVPENRMARMFRNISGMANQMIAEKANNVYMVNAGIPVKIR